ncbi:MAG: DNA/RNA non-specific endonuclease [Chitinophagaceae bacterium]|nr:DNA/RNA non-specific endonuclease [Chitinophagaceae bacterium]
MKKKRYSLTLVIFTLLILIIFCFYCIFEQKKVSSYGKESDTLLYPEHNSDEIIHHKAYSLVYKEEYEQALWAGYELTKDEVLTKKVKRNNRFMEDPAIITRSASPDDYKRSGYDRGHLCPAADFRWDEGAMEESFFMSNMSPQVPQFNRGIWKKLEEKVRDWAVIHEKVYIITGPIVQKNHKTIGKYNKIAVPSYYYKIILDYTEPEKKAIAFLLKNENSKENYMNFAVSIDSIEMISGINFFSNIPDSEEIVLESQINKDVWER